MNDLIKRDDAIECLEKVKECLVLDDQMFVDCLIDDIKRIEPFGKGEQHEIDFSSSKIPNNSDTISRQAAIDALSTPHGILYSIRTVKELPSAQPHWIPCSERLPKEKQDVLLAFKHNMAVGFWEDILNDGGQTWYANSGNGWMTPTKTVDDGGFPLAWMPLPDSYKGEQNE